MWESQWRSQGGGWSRGQSAPPLYSEKFAENQEKEGENQEKAGKRGKIGKKRKNREGSFTLPLLTDRAGYATGESYSPAK